MGTWCGTPFARLCSCGLQFFFLLGGCRRSAMPAMKGTTSHLSIPEITEVRGWIWFESCWLAASVKNQGQILIDFGDDLVTVTLHDPGHFLRFVAIKTTMAGWHIQHLALMATWILPRKLVLVHQWVFSDLLGPFCFLLGALETNTVFSTVHTHTRAYIIYINIYIYL